jgi:hypothetical protein
MTSAEVRGKLLDALKLDLVGPGGELGNRTEVLPQSPSRWYLTGFLAPLDAAPEQRGNVDADDELSSAGEAGLDDDLTPEPAAAAKQRFFPSSIGVSILLPAETKMLNVRVRWGDYRRDGDERSETWRRTPCDEVVSLAVPEQLVRAQEYKVPGSDGLRIALMVQPVGVFGSQAGLPARTRTVSVFLVNRRTPRELDSLKDEAFAFQTELELHADTPFLSRPDARGLLSDEWDENVADLQYRDVGEYAVGHNIAADGDATCVRTCWIPEAQVERVAPAEMQDVTLAMDELAALRDGAEARAKLTPLVEQYRRWIRGQQALVADAPAKRRATSFWISPTASRRFKLPIALWPPQPGGASAPCKAKRRSRWNGPSGVHSNSPSC